MQMPMGKFKGQPVESMSSQYLAWLITRDDIRFKHWTLIEEALHVLRSRDLKQMLTELKVESPIAYKPTPEQIKKKNEQRAEKLRQLEARRRQEAAERRAMWMSRKISSL